MMVSQKGCRLNQREAKHRMPPCLNCRGRPPLRCSGAQLQGLLKGLPRKVRIVVMDNTHANKALVFHIKVSA